MEAPQNEVAVSLDELTLDLSEDIGFGSGDENQIDSCPADNSLDSSKKSDTASSKVSSTDTPFVNLSFILQGGPNDLSTEKTSFEVKVLSLILFTNSLKCCL